MLLRSLAIATLAALPLTACNTVPSSKADRDELSADVDQTIRAFRESDDSMQQFFEDAAGYAVFPTVGKGGMGVGGAYGRGMLVEDGDHVGYCDLTQATIGFQLGGQAYSEIVFFENESALNDFKFGNFEFAAQVSAVAATAGAAATADYEDGVAVFTLTKGGLMYEAAVGGQKFDYVSKD